MISRIARCSKDKYMLEQIMGAQESSESCQPASYKGKVVLKPWGFEYLIFENELVAIWHLHIKNGHSTSMHCHPEKKTSLTLLCGEALSTTFMGRRKLKGLSAMIIDKGVFHSTKSETSEGIELIELESPPDKTDLVRLTDAYGRAKEGYEGLREMRTNDLEECFDFYYLDEPDGPIGQEHFNRHSRCRISISCYNTNEEFQRHFPLRGDSFYQICRGNVYNDESQEMHELGDVFKVSGHHAVSSLSIKEKTVVIQIKN